MASTEDILTGLSFLADRASDIGDAALATVIRNAIASYTGEEIVAEDTPVPNAPTDAIDADDHEVDDLTVEDADDELVTDQPDDGALTRDAVTAALTGEEAVINNLDPVDPLDELAEEVNEAILEAVLPREITLTLTAEGELSAEDAVAAVEMVLPTFNEVLEAEFTIGDIDQTENEASVALVPTDIAGRNRLAAMGAGMDGFNATVPLGNRFVQITSQVGQPDDIDAATEMGLIRDLPAARNGHQINVGVDAIEDATGIRPQIATLEVTYTRADGAELTTEQTQAIVDSPVSQGPGGLPRFGDLMLVDIVDGPTPSAKTAVFEILAVGEIDPASVHPLIGQLTGMATLYRGSLPFPGVGVIGCTSTVTAVEGTMPNLDEEEE